MLGVIEPDSKIAKMPTSLKESLKADAAKLDPSLLDAFKKDLAKREDGSVRLKRMLDAELKAADAVYRGNSNPLRYRLAAISMVVNGRSSKRMRIATRTAKTPREWKEEEWVRSGGRFAAHKGSTRVESVKDFLGKLKDHPHADLRAHVMMMEGRVASRLGKAFGQDVKGWELVLDASDYRHAMANHADEIRDHWGKLPALIAQAEHIIASKERTLSGEKAVEVWRKSTATSRGSWLKLVLVESKDRKIKVKTFKRRGELFNRGKRGSWITSATAKAGGALTSETTQELQTQWGTLPKATSKRPRRSMNLASNMSPLHARCKTLLAALQGGAAA